MYKRQTCRRIYTSFNERLHLNKYSPHEVQKIKHAKNIYIETCKLNGSLEIVTKTVRAHLYISKSWWSFNQTSLIVMHQLYVHLAHASTTKAPYLSRHVRAHNYIKHKRWRFWYPFSFGSRGLASFRTQTFLLAKFKEFILS